MSEELNENQPEEIVESVESETMQTEGNGAEHADVVGAIEVEQQEAVRDANTEPKQDNYLEYLQAEHRRFRNIALVFAIIGFSLFLAGVSLTQNGILPVKFYGLIMSIAYLFIILMAVVIFTRTRPFKRRIKEYTNEPLHKVIDPDAPDGVRIEDRGPNPDMDEMYKILERDIRTELIPDLPEYHRLRKIWITLFVVAALVAIAAIAMYLLFPQTNVVATIILLVAFILVGIAFYFDRTRMRPMRVKWARDHYGESEMMARNHLKRK